VSDSVRANLPSLYWLAVNGFRGERGGVNNLADIRSAYADLEAHYGTPIDETIAIMATKAAVWNFTDPTFALLSTSLDPDPANATATQKARYELMVALMKRLVSDARTDGLSLATTTLDVVFDNSGADFTSAGDGGYFYGPVTAHVQTSNGTGTPEKIYLTASGMYASDFLFVQGTPPAVALLPQEAMYGSQTTAPFVHDGDPFYLKIPATVVGSALVNLDQPTMSFAYLALHGFARSADVTYSGTPAIMAWQGPAGSSPSGEQDWQHVQAFIGFVNNMQASLYGEGSLLLRGDDANASISLQKKVIVSDGASNAGSFVFTLEVKDNSLGQWVPVPLIPQSASPGAYNISGASGLAAISPSGVFSLAENDVVSITGLPLGEYRISEQESEGGYTTVYQLDSFTVEEGSSADLELGMVNTSHTVAFTNTIIPQTPEIPEKPIIPGGGGRIPATGDHNTPVMLLVAALAVGGIGVLVYSQRKARSSQVR
jgi:LPXTG-motif cell wall-anchored protein